MRIVYFLLFVVGFISCEKKNDEEKIEPYVISKAWKDYQNVLESSKLNKHNFPPPPPPKKWSYGNENFIIDDSLNVFYYQFQPKYEESCIQTIDYNVPYFQDIRPHFLIQLPKENLVEFVKLNFKKGVTNKIKIASQKDTLNSKQYFDLLKAFDKYLDRYEDEDRYAIFASTQEEDTVLYYKKHKKWYNPDSIKWDKKRIRFPMTKIDE